jgi:serine/threonine-protein kinase
MRAAHAGSDRPPPGRGSLPNLPTSKSNPPIEAAPQRGSGQHRIPSEPPARAYNSPPRHLSSDRPPPAIMKTHAGKLDHQEEEDDAAETNVFDRSRRPGDQRMEAPTAQFEAVPSTENAGGAGHGTFASKDLDTMVADRQTASDKFHAAKTTRHQSSADQAEDTASLSAAFGALGEPEGGAVSSKNAKISSGPVSSPLRSAVPLPPPSAQKAGLMTQPVMTPPMPPIATGAPGMSTLPSMQQVPMPKSVPPPPMTQPLMSPPLLGSTQPSQPSASPSAPPPGVSTAPSIPPGAYPHSLPPVARLDATYTFPKKEPRGNGFFVALLVAVLAVSAAVVYLFMPRTGTLVVNVADAKGAPVSGLSVTVDGTKKCDSAPCILRDMSAGAHSVSVSAPGYDPVAARAINVESRKDSATDFNLSLSKNVAVAGTGVKIAGPVGAKVSIDGKDYGVLPQDVKDLTPGDHKLTFAGDRYAPMDKTITVGKDEMVDVGTVPLKVTKGKATISLGTPGAKVTLVMGTTRKEVPQFPMAIEFDPSEKWQLQATKDGFDPYSQAITFEDGNAEKTYNITLSPKGTAAAQANNVSGTAAPTPKAKVASNKNKDSDDDDDDKPAKSAAAPSSGKGHLKINSLPSSSVLIDGKPSGQTPLPDVEVSAGTHTITFINSEESLKKTMTVEVKAGETKTAVGKLRE